MRSSRGRLRITIACFAASRWALECRGTTAVTGTGISGRGRTFIFMEYTFGKFSESERDSRQLSWKLECTDARGARVEVRVSGRGRFVHRLPYVKTDCSGRFEVANDSLALARMVARLPGRAAEELTTDSGAVLEMVGS